MKYISWNVNGFRSVLNKGFLDIFNQLDADVFCLQEIKMQEGQADFNPEGYHCYYNYAVKKGYSGVALFTKEKPLNVTLGMGYEEHDTEGRVLCAEYEDKYVVTVYTPNSKRELERLSYRMEWEDLFQSYCAKLSEHKPVIVCGDLNVAHQKIDLKNPQANRLSAGFTDEEREKMTQFLDHYGFVDTFRYLHPDVKERYSWWSNFHQSRTRNVGWRIDYFLVSKDLKDKIKKADILDSIMGSDHCPVTLELGL